MSDTDRTAALRSLLEDNERWLMGSILAYASKTEFTRYTSTLEEAWRASIEGLTDSLCAFAEQAGEDLGIVVDEDLGNDPATQFGLHEAELHRTRGVSLANYLALMKHYRRSYLDLFDEPRTDDTMRVFGRRMTDAFFDRVEIAFCSGWAEIGEPLLMAELQDANRRVTNEKNKFVTLFESLSTPALLLDADGSVDTMNASAASLLLGHIVPGSVYYDAARSAELPPGLAACIDAFIAAEIGADVQDLRLEVGDSSREFVVRLERMLDVSGKFLGITTLLEDVTDERRLRDEAIASRREYEALFHTMNVGFAVHELVTDEDGRPVDYRFLEVNEAFREMTGLDTEPIEGRLVTELIPGIRDDSFDWIDAYGHVALEGTPLEIVQFSEKLGRWYTITAYRPLPGRFATVFADVTETKTREQELETLVAERTADLTASLKQLASANAAKSRFLASMSHELRTPLNSIIGFSGVLLAGSAGPISPEQEAQLRMIRTSGDLLLRLVNEVLDLSRIDANQVDLVVAELDLAGLTRDVVGAARLACAAKGIALTYVSDGAPAVVRSDAARLRQILGNLLDNAVNYTDSGGIAVRLARRGDTMVIEVEDTGRGIPPEDLDSLYVPFVRAGLADGGRPEGSGLGLSISKQLADLLGCTLSCRSQPGRGTTFALAVPGEPAPPTG